jgi:hypothetical protein
MSKLRVKCSCGEVQNTKPGSVCSKCKKPLNIPEQAVIRLYRMGSPLGVAGGFGIYINGEPMGHIGNKETVMFPVDYGTYTIHVAVGMSRKCQDLTVTLTPENRFANAKVWMKPGFWTNSFVIEPAKAEDMPD